MAQSWLDILRTQTHDDEVSTAKMCVRAGVVDTFKGRSKHSADRRQGAITMFNASAVADKEYRTKNVVVDNV